MMKTREQKLESGDASIIADALGTKAGYVSNVVNGHRNNEKIKRAHARLRTLKLQARKQLVSKLKKEFSKNIK